MSDIDQASHVDLANLIADRSDSDVMFFNGELTRGVDAHLIGECIHRRRRPNVLFMLITPGGDADVAYRIARCLQRKYSKFSLYISGYCKSAGTLIALGAHELIISDHGELGPLDVQMMKKDDLVQRQSGLTVMAALEALHDKAFLAYEKYFLETTAKGGGTITVNTAADIATKLATGLFAPLYQQIDPLLVGEAGRALSVADGYGRRLLDSSGNSSLRALKFLATDYPSHVFVIDREEASMLFSSVREPDPVEAALAHRMGERARLPNFGGGPQDVIEILSEEPPKQDAENPGRRGASERNDGQSRAATDPELERTPEGSRGQFSPSVPSGESGTVTPLTGNERKAQRRAT
jgi:Serine dehydrogenase proteinase